MIPSPVSDNNENKFSGLTGYLNVGYDIDMPPNQATYCNWKVYIASSGLTRLLLLIRLKDVGLLLDAFL